MQHNHLLLIFLPAWELWTVKAFSEECVLKEINSYFSTKTYVLGTEKNHLNETVLLSTQNVLKLMGKKIFTILCSSVLLIYAYG